VVGVAKHRQMSERRGADFDSALGWSGVQASMARWATKRAAVAKRYLYRIGRCRLTKQEVGWGWMMKRRRWWWWR
jgi:hypothetical protein